MNSDRYHKTKNTIMDAGDACVKHLQRTVAEDTHGVVFKGVVTPPTYTPSLAISFTKETSTHDIAPLHAVVAPVLHWIKFMHLTPNSMNMLIDALGMVSMSILTLESVLTLNKIAAKATSAKRRRRSATTRTPQNTVLAVNVICSKFVSDFKENFFALDALTRRLRLRAIVRKEETAVFLRLGGKLRDLHVFEVVQHRIQCRLAVGDKMTMRQLIGCGCLVADAVMVIVRSDGITMSLKALTTLCELVCCAWLGIDVCTDACTADVVRHIFKAMCDGSMYGEDFEHMRHLYVLHTCRAMWFTVMNNVSLSLGPQC